MTSIAGQFLSLKKRLGAINTQFCSIDAVIADSLERAQASTSPERHIEELARKKGYHLSYEQTPDLRKPLGSFGIVFQHQVLEGFLQDLESFIHKLPSYQEVDPKSADPQPKGEDMLRRVIRKLWLANNQQRMPDSYKDESDEAKAQREENCRSMAGSIELSLLEYYRLVRNAAVHADIDQIASTYYRDHFADTSNQRVKQHNTNSTVTLDRIERLYKAKPSRADQISINDMILHSRVIQKISQVLLTAARPDIRTDVLPTLRKSFSKYQNAQRRQRAIANALRTDYLLDAADALEYAVHG